METSAHLLSPDDFPLTIEVVRSDNLRFVWGATVLKPRGGRLAELWVPPCSKWIGMPVYVRMTTGTGEQSLTGPHDMREP
jgi:hypothetical protein